MLENFINRTLSYLHDRMMERVCLYKKNNFQCPAHVDIGRHTYGAETAHFFKPSEGSSIRIGNFCSIAAETVFLGISERATDLPSLYPFRTKFNTGPKKYFDAKEKGPTVISHDVWFGRGSTILSGVTIGTGAIIGAGSVVTKDVPPYAIVAGSPAEIKKYRFNDEDIRLLLDSRWWDLPDESIKKLDPYFYSTDIAAFAEAVQKEWALQ